jgi:ribosome-binding protein aMBF1 (putative translation factor)
MRRRKWSQNQLADELEVDSSQVNRWLHGALCPGLHAANVIKKRLGIPTEAWEDGPKRPIVLRTGTDG